MNSKKKSNKKWYKDFKSKLKVKNKINDAKEKFSEFLELPKEVLLKSTKVTIIDCSNILIEGYQSIVDYYDNYIKIKTGNMYIVIDGTMLDIKEISDFELVIVGKIYSINYQNKEE